MHRKIKEYEEFLDNKFRVTTDETNTRPVILLRLATMIGEAKQGSREDNDLIENTGKGMAAHLEGMSEDIDEESAVFIESIQLVLNIITRYGAWKGELLMSTFMIHARRINSKIYNKFFSKRVLHEEYLKNKDIIEKIVEPPSNLRGGAVQSGGGWGIRTFALIAAIISGNRLYRVASGYDDPLSDNFAFPAFISGFFTSPELITESAGYATGLGEAGMLGPLDSSPSMTAAVNLESSIQNATDVQDEAYAAKIKYEGELTAQLKALHLSAHNPHSVEAGILDICPEYRESRERLEVRERVLKLQRQLANNNAQHKSIEAKMQNLFFNRPSADELKLFENYTEKHNSTLLELNALNAILGNLTHISCTSPTSFFGDAESGIDSVGRQLGTLLALTVDSAAQQGLLAPQYATAESGVFAAVAGYGRQIIELQDRQLVNLTAEVEVSTLTEQLRDSTREYDATFAQLSPIQKGIDSNRAKVTSLQEELKGLSSNRSKQTAKITETEGRQMAKAITSINALPFVKAIEKETRELGQTNASIESKSSEIVRLNATYATLEAQADPIRVELYKRSNTKNSYERSLSEKSGQLANLRQQRDIAVRAIDSRSIGAPLLADSGNSAPFLLGNSTSTWKLVTRPNGNERVAPSRRVYMPASSKRPITTAMVPGSIQRVALEGAFVSNGANLPSVTIGPPGHEITLRLPTGKRISMTPEQLAHDITILGNLTALRDHVLSMVEDPLVTNWQYIEANIRKNLIHALFVKMVSDEKLITAGNSRSNMSVAPQSAITELTINYALSLAANRWYELSASKLESARTLKSSVASTQAKGQRDQIVTDITSVYFSRFERHNSTDANYDPLVNVAIVNEVGRIITELNMLPNIESYSIIAEVVYNTMTRYYNKGVTTIPTGGAVLITKEKMIKKLTENGTFYGRVSSWVKPLWLDLIVIGFGCVGLLMIGGTVDLFFNGILGIIEDKINRVRRKGERANKINAARDEGELAEIRAQTPAVPIVQQQAAPVAPAVAAVIANATVAQQPVILNQPPVGAPAPAPAILNQPPAPAILYQPPAVGQAPVPADEDPGMGGRRRTRGKHLRRKTRRNRK